MSDKKSYSPAKGGPDNGGFKKFLWNPDTSEFLGRTGASWLKITIFYIIFFAGLAAFFGLMLWIFYQTLDMGKPKWIGENGLIGSNPGVGFRPMPDQDKNVESTLIWYKRGEGDAGSFWSDQLKVMWDQYAKGVGTGSLGENCNWATTAGANRFCKVQLEKINGSCTDAFNFGYQKGEPCILIKLNRIYGWTPEPYTAKDKLPSDMPLDLQKRINDTPAEQPHVWFSCDGENPADKENLGNVEYIPNQGIPTYFFPFMNQHGYQSPFIFVRLANPLNGVLINVECKAWAKNIHPSRLDRVGTVHFEIMID
jgi:sodium/potassium-transporting ATPase subunit beta